MAATSEWKRSGGEATSVPPDRARALLAIGIITLSGLAAYYSSLDGVFLFDDRTHILGDRLLKTLWPLTEAASRNRPVVDYSFAVNYAIGGENPRGYHVVNLAIHLLAGWTLFGVVRRTLLAPALSNAFRDAAVWVALVIAILWTVHPLNTQSVTYIVQRAESMMGLFYLLTLYCAIRAAESQRGVGWRVAAVVACAIGMCCKGVMITAPVAVVLYDRALCYPSFRDCLRRRWGLYAGMVSTWLLLWVFGTASSVLSTRSIGASVGFGFQGISPLDYLLTQFGVVLEYVRLSFWPNPLCLDYQWPVARTPARILPAFLGVAALIAVTLLAWWRRPAAGFAAAWFFLILLPTSSIVPIRDPLFEHRMYLPLAGVIVLAVVSLRWLLRGAGRWLRLPPRTVSVASVMLAILTAGSLGWATHRRNLDYHDEIGMWHDVVTKRPGNTRAAENYASFLVSAKRRDEALKVLGDAVKASPTSATLRNTYGFALLADQRLDEAIGQFREAVRLNPTFEMARLNLGKALSDKGEPGPALQELQTAVAMFPQSVEARFSLANEYVAQGNLGEAIRQYETLVAINPRHASGWGNLGLALLQQRRIDEAARALHQARQLNPTSSNVLNGLGLILLEQNKVDEAIETFRDALVANPGSPEVHYNLAGALMRKKNWDGAARSLSQAIQARPNDPEYRYALGVCLMQMKHIKEAIAQFEAALQLNPNHAEAAAALQKAREQLPAEP